LYDISEWDEITRNWISWSIGASLEPLAPLMHLLVQAFYGCAPWKRKKPRRIVRDGELDLISECWLSIPT